MKNVLTRLLALLVFASLTLSVSSCSKEEGFKAKIIVTNEQGEEVQNTDIHIYAPDPLNPELLLPGSIVDEWLKTNIDGVAMFNYPYKAVLMAVATKGTFSGVGYLELEQGETIKETIIIRP